MIVGGTTPSRMPSKQNIISTAPAAPRRWPVIDFVAPLVPIGLAAGRLGNFYSQTIDYNDRGEGLFYKPEKFGRSVLADAPAQVEAARQLLAWLKGQVPGLQVGTHRQVALDRSGCCGPDLWREVGQYAVDVLGMREIPVDGGRPIPDEWDRNRIAEVMAKAGAGALMASGIIRTVTFIFVSPLLGLSLIHISEPTRPY